MKKKPISTKPHRCPNQLHCLTTSIEGLSTKPRQDLTFLHILSIAYTIMAHQDQMSQMVKYFSQNQSRSNFITLANTHFLFDCIVHVFLRQCFTCIFDPTSDKINVNIILLWQKIWTVTLNRAFIYNGRSFSLSKVFKGQLISKCLLDVIVSTKKPTNYF